MTAKEMFEKLGYKEKYSVLDKICYFNSKDNVRVRFYETDYGNSIMIEDDCHMATFVSAKELQAINKQVEELDWNKKEE